MKRVMVPVVVILASSLIGTGGAVQQPDDSSSDATSPVWSAQQPYAGDCKERPAGMVCLEFSDNYVWLISDSVLGWATEDGVEIAYGCEAEYWHELGTSLVWTRAPRVECTMSDGALSGLILVDASRDGGVWWAPQAGPEFCPGAAHQGSELADHLRYCGYQVVELGRSAESITDAQLAQAQLVIRANCCGQYVESEIQAYLDYVRQGGRLLLLSDYLRPGELDLLSLAFGVVGIGISRGENVLVPAEGQPIVAGIAPVPYGVGSGIVGRPTGSLILATLSPGTYLDLDDDSVKDLDEPRGSPALVALEYGTGRVVFCGDTNLFEREQAFPLLDRVTAWLLGD